MAYYIFDAGELDIFSQNLLKQAKDGVPKDARKFVGKQARVLRKVTVKKAKAKTKKHTGNYYKGIKAGKVYKYRKNDGISSRVYNAAPAFHAALLEYGHLQVQNPPKERGRGVKPGKGIGRVVGFVPGLHIFEEAAKEFTPQFYQALDDFLDEVIGKL